MTRPLMQHGVGKLAELFSNSKADAKVLKQLENELQYRQVPRAVALLAEVQAAIHGGAPATTPATVSTSSRVQAPAPITGSQRSSLWGRSSEPPVVAPPLRTVPLVAKSLGPPLPTKPEISTPVIPLEDAYKVLKATPGVTWESIEQTRRMLVQLSHPSQSKSISTERRTLALVEARRVNAAYAALSQARCGGG